ncbi:MAG: hypothetical protein WD381_07490 [Balneolaceae bacterium]
MKYLSLRVLYFMLALLMLSYCTSVDQTDSSPVIAQIGNNTLTLEEAITRIPKIALEQDTVQALEEYKRQWLNTQILIDEAERFQLDEEPEIQNRLDRLKNQLLEDALKEHILAENKDELEVTREEAQNYFQANRDKFVLDERYVRFRHITTNTRMEADNAKRDIMRGIEWGTVVNNYSVNPDLQLRESTQFWPMSMAVSDIPMLSRFLGIIGISEISPVHFYRGNYHFVQLQEVRNEGDHPDFDWLIPQIQEWLKLEKSRRITNAYVRNLYLQVESNNEIDEISINEIEQHLTDYFSNLDTN